MQPHSGCCLQLQTSISIAGQVPRSFALAGGSQPSLQPPDAS